MSIPRLAMFNDITGFGRCSTAVSLPVISAMQVQVCPVPTCIFSNHLGFPICYVDDYTSHMRAYLSAWKELGISFDGLYCGFLGNASQIEIVEEFLEDFHPGFFILDPVMGDHGRFYSDVTPEYCQHLKSLLSRVDLATPNITEACLLTDTPFTEHSWTDYDLQEICEKMAAFCPGSIVITGLVRDNYYLNYIWQNGRRSTCTWPKSGISRPGTGDLFASILAADAMNHVPLMDSVQKASVFVARCITASEDAGIPVKEGVLFEKYLRELMWKY